MAAADGNAKSGKFDPAWNYGFLNDPKNRNDVTCSFCQIVTKGGIFRLKQHLVGGYPNVKTCKRCPDHVRTELHEYMSKKKRQREELNLVSDAAADLDSQQNLDEFDHDCYEHEPVVDRNGKRPMHGTQTSVRQVQVGPLDQYIRPKPTETAQPTKRQTTMNEAYKMKVRAKMCEDMARVVYKTGIPFRIVDDDDWKQMCDSIARAGIGAKPPSAYEVRVPLLKDEVERTDQLMKVHRDEWEKFGCSIMSDGWTDRRQRSIVNFLANSSRGTMFLESVDASSYSKTGFKIFQLLCNVIERVGEKNVVQVISDNGANFVSAGLHFLKSKLINGSALTLYFGIRNMLIVLYLRSWKPKK